MTETTTKSGAQTAKPSSAAACYMATLDSANVNCPECNMPMLYDFDHIRCCGTECSIRGKKFRKPKLALEAI